MSIRRIGHKYVGSLVANCIDATIRLSDNNIPEEELSPYLKLEQEIIFKVNSFDATHSFIDGIIDTQCLDKMKQFIQLNEFEGYFYFNQTFVQISLISSLFSNRILWKSIISIKSRLKVMTSFQILI